MTWKVSILLLLVPLLVNCSIGEARVKRERYAVSHYKLGVAHLIDERPSLQKAYIEFQKTIKLDPSHRDAHYALGHIHFQQESYKKAIESFKKAISIDHEYSEAYNYLGRVYSLLGESDKAIAAYQAALKNVQYDTPEKPYWNMGLIYARQKKYADAVRELKNALRVSPDFVSVYNLLGRVYAKMGETEKSIASYLKVLKIAPKNINAHYNLACLYQEEGSDALAEAGFNQVIALSPQLEKEEDLRKCLNPIE